MLSSRLDEKRGPFHWAAVVELVELEDMLARELGLNVQLGTHDALHPLIKSKIEREAVRVF